MADFFDRSSGFRRRDLWIALALLAVALLLYFLPDPGQEAIRGVARGTVLRPFMVVQAAVVEQRNLSGDPARLQAERDSLAAIVAAQAPLAEENRRLRALLQLRSRAERSLVPAEVLRVGFEGAESTFLIDVGGAAGVAEGSPVLTSNGLLGVVWEVDENVAQAVDWTHTDFRASAMTADGEIYGIVEPRRGRFREEDMLALTGTPFHSDLQPGARIVTSGRGGIFPRGIPIGTVVGIEEADTGWRKSYLLRPAVRPESASHVLVGLQAGDGTGGLADLWYVPAPEDTVGGDTAAVGAE